MALAPGLYVVATPIGAARDVTLRALDILREADLLAAEDTRQARKLMEIHGIPLAGRKLVPYHDHNGAQQRPRLLAALAEGRSLALVSDAGTPLIADPGYDLVRAAIEADLPVHSAPGASAVLAALSVAGLPTDRFMFAGFLPPKAAARRSAAEALKPVPATLVIYESPRRLAAALDDLAAVLGPARPAALCRELTKRFEEVHRAPLGDLAAHYKEAAAPKGEIVLVIGPPPPQSADAETLDAALRAALDKNSLKDAAQIVAVATGLPRKQVYARALELSADE